MDDRVAGYASSKVLILDESRTVAPAIKNFCDGNNLVALMGRRAPALSLLRTNADLGGILLSEMYGWSRQETADLAQELHALRPEVPIILRREHHATLDGLPHALRSVCSAAYVAGELESLRSAIDTHIFTLHYPPALLRGIAEISERVLATEFGAFSVTPATPLIVHDRVVFGELFSLIPLESPWCRGYLLLQTEESELLKLLDLDAASSSGASIDALKDRLREATNLIWGLFKNRYAGDLDVSSASNVQVPLVFNLREKSVSFGASSTHLCLRYRLTDEARDLSLWVCERFVFNLTWNPANFDERCPSAEAGSIAAGGLEYF
jgi:hypothetical protein